MNALLLLAAFAGIVMTAVISACLLAKRRRLETFEQEEQLKQNMLCSFYGAFHGATAMLALAFASAFMLSHLNSDDNEKRVRAAAILQASPEDPERTLASVIEYAMEFEDDELASTAVRMGVSLIELGDTLSSSGCQALV